MSDCYKNYVPVLKAISDGIRLKIIDMLSCGPLCACDILDAFSITQPTLSYHMKILTKCGIVIATRDGAWMNYCLNQENVIQLLGFLQRITTEKQDCICRQCKGSSNNKKECLSEKKGNEDE